MTEQKFPQEPMQPPKEEYRAPMPMPCRKEYGIRRVGTITAGFTLIAVGIVAIIGMFVPRFDFWMAFRLSPVILICLGIEILVNYFLHRQDKIKYDVLSMLLCAGLVLFVAVMMAAYAAARWHGYLLW